MSAQVVRLADRRAPHAAVPPQRRRRAPGGVVTRLRWRLADLLVGLSKHILFLAARVAPPR